MEFNQPTALPTDAETQNHINALNAQIADKEATIVRHNGVVTSLQYTIQQLSNEKADLELKIPALKDDREKLNKDLNTILIQIAEATQGLTKIESESIVKKAELDKREKDVENKIAALKQIIN